MCSLTRALVSATLPLLVACATAAPKYNLRVQVTTATDWSDLAAFGERAAQSAGVPVRNVAGIAPRRYAFTLACANAAECELAMQRLKAEAGLIQSVEIDGRSQTPRTPTPSTSR